MQMSGVCPTIEGQLRSIVLVSAQGEMGHGEQDKPTGKSGITLDQRTGGAVSCGPFPIP